MGDRACAALLLLALGGCSEDTGIDAGADASVDATTSVDAMVTPPAIPWLADGRPPVDSPRFTPCPDGWREVPPGDADGVATCDPYPEGGAETCPFGQAHFPGEPGCAPVGSPCPAGEWADGLPDDGTVLFVRAGATGGDGTRAAPLGVIADAMALATDGSTVALAKGRYTEPVTLGTEGVTVRGACVADTVMAVPLSDPFTIDALRTAIRDIGIVEAGSIGVVAVGEDAQVTLDGVWIDSQELWGVLAQDGASITARSLVMGAGAPLGSVFVVRGASVQISRAVLDGGDSVGVWAGDGSVSISIAPSPRRPSTGR